MIIRTENNEIIDLSKPICISIEINFNGEQPNTYGVEIADAEAYRAGEFIGDVREGGSCNFEKYKIIPHCNGTHTECIGHITKERIYVNDIFDNIFFKAELITVNPVIYSEEIKETYQPKIDEGDLLITSEMIPEVISGDALIVRTKPNDESKKVRRYEETGFPYFTNEAMEKINKSGIKHLLVDMPSIDRMYDGGKLSNHHIYWGLKKGDEVGKNYSKKTISEMVFADDFIKNGVYMCCIQIPDWKGDASPSRIFLYEIIKQ
ncbi:MAG TPA: cyclase family protein [Ignavibacteria bacterium]|nr:cyclase family protein [Ignavibacteria bacterium]